MKQKKEEPVLPKLLAEIARLQEAEELLSELYGQIDPYHGSQIPRQHEYDISEIEQTKELAGVLQDAVYEKKIRYYTLEFRKLENTIVVRWGD